VHQRGDVADRADIDLAARQEGHGAVEIDGEATLDLVEDDAFDALALRELLLELDPALFAAGLVAGKHRFAKRVLDALDIDLDCVADLQRGVPALGAELLQRDATLDLEADVDDGHVLFDGRDEAPDDLAFARMAVRERLFEKRREIVACGICCRHIFSWKPRLDGAGAVVSVALACRRSGLHEPSCRCGGETGAKECWQAGSVFRLRILA
jgi:hypothetical protein